MRYPAILAAVLTATAYAAPAAASAPVERVPYGDLALTTAEGQAELQKRVNKAAWRVCMFDERGVMRPSEEQTACYRTARKDIAVRLAQVVADSQHGG